MRMEISNIDEKLAKKIKKWGIDNKQTLGGWAEKAHNSLTSKA